MTAKKEKALAALLACPTKEAAARAAGISPRTLRRYMSDADFQADYKSAVSGVVEDAARQAQRSLNPALEALNGIVQDPDEGAAQRVSAARTLLEYGIRLTEQADVLSQLADLERRIGGDDFGKH